jgi:hypothetical protein
MYLARPTWMTVYSGEDVATSGQKKESHWRMNARRPAVTRAGLTRGRAMRQ